MDFSYIHAAIYLQITTRWVA